MTININDVKRIVSLHMGVSEVRDEDHFLEDLGAESMDVLNIIATIEEKYNVAIKDSEIPDLQTPVSLYRFIKERS